METSLGSAIRARREELGLTQEELADRVAALGDETLRQSDISRIERGQVRLPRLPRLEMIAEALGFDVGSLLIAAGWLGAERARPAATAQEESNTAAMNSATEPPQYSRVLEAYEQSIRNAYDQLVESPVGALATHEQFERRKSQFEEMVRRFERVRDEFERMQTEQDRPR